MFTSVRTRLGRDLRTALAADVEASGLVSPPRDATRVIAADLAGLPGPVHRYLEFMGVVGRPRDASFRARFTGRFRMRPGQRFMPFEAWQYNTRVPVARLFHMRIDFAGLVPMVGRDAYLDGHGTMRGTLLGAVPVATGSGPEFDLGELVTWLNDAILFCPSMLLDPATRWAAIDHDSFTVSFTDSGLTVSARVRIDEHGAPVDFRTTDRSVGLPEGLLRAEWTTPVSRWEHDGDRPRPGPSAAIWTLPDGPFTYVEATAVPGSVEYDVALDSDAESRVARSMRDDVATRSRTLLVEAADAASAVPTMAVSPLFRARHLRWGATDAEVAASMPGDDLVPISHFTATRAITIAAPPARVWPWLAQVGVGRAGFYSYDLLDNLGRPSATEPLAQWQNLRVGDLVAPMKNPPTPNTAFVVHSSEPNRAVVWSKTDSTWAWTLTPLGGGRTRLVTRIKQRYRPTVSAALTVVLAEFGDFAMMRKMLLGIKARAEHHPDIDLEGEHMNDDTARELLRAERERVQALLDAARVAGRVDRDGAAEAGDMTDPAPSLVSEQVDDAVAAGFSERLEAIARAEARLAVGTYGRSVRSGLAIADARLLADPAAELTIEEARHTP